MVNRVNRLGKAVGTNACPRCGLPLRGPVARIIRLSEGEKPPKPCPACKSRGLGAVTIGVVER